MNVEIQNYNYLHFNNNPYSNSFSIFLLIWMIYPVVGILIAMKNCRVKYFHYFFYVFLTNPYKKCSKVSKIDMKIISNYFFTIMCYCVAASEEIILLLPLCWNKWWPRIDGIRGNKK